MRFITAILFLLPLSVFAAPECFLDYHNVCGQLEGEQAEVFLNQCDLKDAGAKQVSWKQCESEVGRSPAASQTNFFEELQQVENEIQIVADSEA